MFNRPIKEINAEFLAEDKYLDSIQRTVEESCVAAGMKRSDIASVLVAIEEGASNIIRHAYLYEKGTIRLRIVIYKKMIVFSLIDFGRSFQPDEVDSLDLDRLVESGRKGGLGLYMIRKIMDSVEMISAAGRNELRMTKRIHPRSTDSVPLLARMSSLRVKFSFWTFLIVLVIVGGSYYYIDRQTSKRLYQHLDDTVLSLANTIAEQAGGYIINRRSDAEFDELIVSYLHSNAEFMRLVVLTDSNDNIIAHSEDIRYIRNKYQIPVHIDTTLIGKPQRFTYKNEHLRYVIVPIKAGDATVGKVHVAYSTASIKGQFTQARKKTAALTAVLILFGILGIYLLSNYFVSPIEKITRRVRRFASGDVSSELPLEGAEEFFEISRAFNELTARVSQDRENIVAREKMAKEIEVASQIQKTLMPHRLPDIPGLDVEAFYQAASVVSGDLYDIFQIDETHYCLTVADVSGKGVPASLVMSMLRTVVQIQSQQTKSSRDTLIRVYDYLQSNIPAGMFITIMLAIYDTSEHHLNFVSAGHNPMIYFHANKGEIVKLNPAGMPMGLPDSFSGSFESRLEEMDLTLHRGDFFLMFTDGITEARNRDGEQYGIDRLIAFMEKRLHYSANLTATGLSEQLIAELGDFSPLSGPADDITFILARVVDDTT